MFFTQEDYRNIEKWLQTRAVKDTDLKESDPLLGKEEIAIIQDGKNKRTSLKQLVSVVIHDFLNVTTLSNMCNLSLEDAVALVPPEKRKLGLAITYRTIKGNWVIMQFTGTSVNQWSMLSNWQNIVEANLEELHNVYADEEDITADVIDGKSYLKLKDRHHNTDNFVDKGLIILRRNYTGTNACSVDDEDHIINILTQDMIGEASTIYVVQYNFDLQGENLSLPKDCVLLFKGGSINNGSLTLNNTSVLGAAEYSEMGNAIFLGSFNTGQVMTFAENERQLLKWYDGRNWVLVLDTTDQNTINAQITNLAKKHDTDLSSIEQSFTTRLNSISTSVAANRESINSISSNMDSLNRAMTDLEHKIPTEGFVNQTTFNSFASKVTEVENQMQVLKSDIRNLQDLVPRVVAIENELTNIRATTITTINLEEGQSEVNIDLEAYNSISGEPTSADYNTSINNNDFSIE